MAAQRRLRPIFAIVRRLLPALLVVAADDARAFEIPTGTDDLRVRFDNTLRYNAAFRVRKQDGALLGNAGIDDGDRNFARGLVSNRLDLLSELDAVWRDSLALRVSGAGWYDNVYAQPLDNHSVATSNHLDENGNPAIGLSKRATKLFRGPGAELLDAFGYAKFDIGEIPFSVKAGRHTVYWGESLLLGGAAHGVSYSQMPLDLAKGLAVPGSEAKELFRPLNSISAQSQIVDSLSLAGQYFLQWDRFRLPESGTYLDFNDALDKGGESVILASGVRVVHAADIEPKQRGNWGLSARWSPEFLDGTLGFYYRRTADMLPQVAVIPDLNLLSANNCGSLTAPSVCAIAGEYRFDYPGNIKIYGLSLAKNIAGISVSAELSYRGGMPLSSEPAVILTQPVPAALQGPLNDLLRSLRQVPLPAVAGVPSIPAVMFGSLPQSGGAVGARGNTMHGVVNAIGLVNRVDLFGVKLLDAASYIVEGTWSRWNSVSENQNLFKGRGDYTALDRATRNNFAVGVNLNPVWYQVLPNMDLSAPLSYSRGLRGNSAVQFGGSKGGGVWTAGISADFYARFRIDLKYADFFGDVSTNSSGAAAVLNGATAPLRDRDFVSLTLKTTF